MKFCDFCRCSFYPDVAPIPMHDDICYPVMVCSDECAEAAQYDSWVDCSGEGCRYC